MATETKTETKTKTYTKEQLLESEKYAGKRDLLSALLDGKKKYSLADVDKMIDKYMKGEVK